MTAVREFQILGLMLRQLSNASTHLATVLESLSIEALPQEEDRQNSIDGHRMRNAHGDDSAAGRLDDSDTDDCLPPLTDLDTEQG